MHPETAAIRGGETSRMGLTPPVVTPIYQTAAFTLPSTAAAAGIFSLDQDGHAYTRLNNPTLDVLEERIALLDGAVDSLAVASGQAAVALAVLNLCQAGDNLVSSRELYGGTWNLLANTLHRLGIETRFVDPENPANFAAATDAATRCYFAETLPNPGLRMFPIAEVAEIAAGHGIPLILDNTMLPTVCRPMEFGADIVVYSATKYIGGHGSSLGGLIVDSGRFDWVAHRARHPLITEPDDAHGGTVWTSAGDGLETHFARSPYLLKARETLLRDFGPCLSPFNAFLLIQGVETLPIRMRVHCANAQLVAEYLAEHPKAAEVSYPSLSKGAELDRAKRYLGAGFGPVLQFEVVGGREAGGRFIESLELISHVTNIGDVRTMATHPASTTHAQLPAADQLAAGVTPGSIRLAVGLEHPDDLMADIGRALDAA
ncbi:MAG TPA: PLP-dependent transferase [Pseudonocardiaceae bacterium]|jgi:O-acetylhomoserine (thiol)-lyase